MFMPLSFAQTETLIVFEESDWVHVSVGGNTVASIVWEQYDEDVQLVFYAYNDTGLSFNQFIMDENRSYSDPFNKFQTVWKGEITIEGKIKLYLSSTQGQISTIVEKFGGESSWGRPGTHYEHRVATYAGEVKDVYIDAEKICIFEWNYEKVDNKTVPQLTVYSPNGNVDSTGTLTSTYVSVVEYFDKVGFMFERMGDDYVKWMLYSGQEMEVRSSQESGASQLPFFKVSPADNEVYPGDIVTAEWELPDGVTEYEVSWEDKQISEHVRLVDENIYNGRYETTFKFLDSAKDQIFTIKVSCEKYGTLYQGKEKVEVLIPLLESLFWVIVIIAILCVGTIIFIYVLIPRIRESTDVDTAIRESTCQ